MSNTPLHFYGGKWDGGHVQGIAFDSRRGFVYYSHTTVLVKTDLLGNVVGTVGGLVGHLGCIDFNPEDGKLYGSLEFKNDDIGRGIFKALGREGECYVENCFYIAVFEVDKITREGLDAEKDGIMTTVYLQDVAADFHARSEDGKEHAFGCSGADGLSFGPVFGADKDSPRQLMIAYGIYSETDRTDNDYQVILQYDWRKFDEYRRPLSQTAPHHEGPLADARYYFYTGNTNYGVQNLCYDPTRHHWLVAVYSGKKAAFPNYPMFLIDGAKAPTRQALLGRTDEGDVLSPAPYGILHGQTGIRGFRFPYGSTGIQALGEDLFYFSHPSRFEENGKIMHACDAYLYRFTGEGEWGFELVK